MNSKTLIASLALVAGVAGITPLFKRRKPQAILPFNRRPAIVS
ncbi:hypothetical protein MZE46_002150 [Pseudomonas sp. A4]|nr:MULTISPECIES: hypothetical protein [unclassified Pseudomonas]MCR8930676.1 hypothetical protein [Pseudomonas sp. S11A4]MCR8974279.1 hypothetical protein [Pseudomonas sp. S11P7]